MKRAADWPPVFVVGCLHTALEVTELNPIRQLKPIWVLPPFYLNFELTAVVALV